MLQPMPHTAANSHERGPASIKVFHLGLNTRIAGPHIARISGIRMRLPIIGSYAATTNVDASRCRISGRGPGSPESRPQGFGRSASAARPSAPRLSAKREPSAAE
jgi:hypothetical protein